MCCVQSIILHHQTPLLLDPLSPARLTLLAVLLANCINTSTILPQCPKQPLVAAFDGTPLACDSEQFETVMCLCVYLSVSVCLWVVLGAFEIGMGVSSSTYIRVCKSALILTL